jgi:GntR family transcriptional regulator
MTRLSFQKLQEDLKGLITSLPAESRLLSEPRLAKKMGVSRATLREAMRSFETQGLIRRQQGVGTFVIGEVPIMDTGLEVLESIEKIARRIGLNVSTRSLEIEQLEADEECACALDLKIGSPLTRISRVILTDERPVAYLVDTLPSSLLIRSEFEKELSSSVLDYLLQKGSINLANSRTEIKAEVASSEVAHKLQIQRGDVLLNLTADLSDFSGKVIDHSYSYFLPGFFRFHVNRRVG